MRSRAPLVLMEQMVMLLVFALAAALCLQAFVKSDEISSRNEARDHAAIVCQTAAETIRNYGGDAGSALSRTAQDLGAEYSEEFTVFSLDYDKDWNPLPRTDMSSYYRLVAESVPADVPGLQMATVSVITGNGNVDEMLDTVFALDVAWQEVSAHG